MHIQHLHDPYVQVLLMLLLSLSTAAYLQSLSHGTGLWEVQSDAGLGGLIHEAFFFDSLSASSSRSACW
jgi:hypothetical protein